MSEEKKRNTDKAKSTIYSCESCHTQFGSAKEMVYHYKVNHPDSVESVTLPI